MLCCDWDAPGLARTGAALGAALAGVGDALAAERVGAPVGRGTAAPELRTGAFTGLPGIALGPGGVAAFAGVLAFDPAADPEGFD